jgi:hypothetical protein
MGLVVVSRLSVHRRLHTTHSAMPKRGHIPPWGHSVCWL